MPTRQALDVFAQHPQRLASSLSGSLVTVSRTSSTQFDRDAILGAAPEDGFALVYRLADMPSHGFWNDDGYSRVEPTAMGTLQIVDLQGGVRSRFESVYDNLHIRVPRQALLAITEQAGRAPIHTLAVPDAWETRDPMFAALTGSFLRALHHPEEVEPLVADHLVQAMLAHVATAYGGMKRLPPSLRGALNARQVERAKDLLSAELSNAPAIADVARAIGISPGHFSRAFKSATGISPSGWLIRHRSEHAMHLLRATDLPLVDISMRSGFADQSHFTRTFGKSTGMAPGAWRRENKGG